MQQYAAEKQSRFSTTRKSTRHNAQKQREKPRKRSYYKAAMQIITTTNRTPDSRTKVPIPNHITQSTATISQLHITTISQPHNTIPPCRPTKIAWRQTSSYAATSSALTTALTVRAPRTSAPSSAAPISTLFGHI